MDEPQGSAAKPTGPEQLGPTSRERRRLKICILTLGVLFIVQALLNISLSLALFSKGHTNQFRFNGSLALHFCGNDQPEARSSKSCSCENNLLRELREAYQALETERDHFHSEVIRLTEDDSNYEEPDSDSWYYNIA